MMPGMACLAASSLLLLLLLPPQHVEGFHPSSRHLVSRCPQRQAPTTNIPMPFVCLSTLLHAATFPEPTSRFAASPPPPRSRAHPPPPLSPPSTSVAVIPPQTPSAGQVHPWYPFIELLRPQNVLPSMCLVLMGAWITTRDLRRVLDPVVIVMGITSALVAVGSCVLNDVFDLKIDRINHPERTLVQGKVHPLHALLLALGCLSTALLLGNSVVGGGLTQTSASNGFFSLFRQATSGSVLGLASAGGGSAAASGTGSAPLPMLLLQRIVHLAVLAVTLYTPVFKPLPFLKNGVVALVTAASVALGGLAALAVSTTSSISSSLPSSILASAFLVFCHMYHREILMDIDDTEGDEAGQILTLPRLLGKPLALLLGGGLVALGAVVSAWVVGMQHGLRLSSLRVLQNGVVRGGAEKVAGTLAGIVGLRVVGATAAWFAPVAVCVAGMSVCAYDWRVVWRRGFLHDDVSKGIAWGPLAMVLMLLLMGTGSIA